MTPGELKEFAHTMRTYGISHLKIHDCEIQMGPGSLVGQATDMSVDGGSSPSLGADLTPGLDASAVEPDPIKHRVEELSSLLKLSDVDLVDRLFPEPQNESA